MEDRFAVSNEGLREVNAGNFPQRGLLRHERGKRGRDRNHQLIEDAKGFGSGEMHAVEDRPLDRKLIRRRAVGSDFRDERMNLFEPVSIVATDRQFLGLTREPERNFLPGFVEVFNVSLVDDGVHAKRASQLVSDFVSELGVGNAHLSAPPKAILLRVRLRQNVVAGFRDDSKRIGVP